jgi:hypothetical protein
MEPGMDEYAREASEEALLKYLEMEWQDHFQTRSQTWRALEVTSILAVALVGLDWRLDQPVATIVAASLLILVAQFAIQITLRHRKVEQEKFRVITAVEKRLGVHDPKHTLPAPVTWFSIFRLRQANTSLFILRMLFVIQLFSIGYLALRLLYLLHLFS